MLRKTGSLEAKKNWPTNSSGMGFLFLARLGAFTLVKEG
jgi:hypothetical protein